MLNLLSPPSLNVALSQPVTPAFQRDKQVKVISLSKQLLFSPGLETQSRFLLPFVDSIPTIGNLQYGGQDALGQQESSQLLGRDKQKVHSISFQPSPTWCSPNGLLYNF